MLWHIFLEKLELVKYARKIYPKSKWSQNKSCYSSLTLYLSFNNNFWFYNISNL